MLRKINLFLLCFNLLVGVVLLPSVSYSQGSSDNYGVQIQALQTRVDDCENAIKQLSKAVGSVEVNASANNVFVPKPSEKYYHVKECKSLNVDKGKSISLSVAEGSGYKPCPSCDPLSKLTVLVTRTGECYHIGCKGKIPMSLEESRKQYRACKVCNPDRKVFVSVKNK